MAQPLSQHTLVSVCPSYRAVCAVVETEAATVTLWTSVCQCPTDDDGGNIANVGSSNAAAAVEAAVLL
jgi:hypothetical protein